MNVLSYYSVMWPVMWPANMFLYFVIIVATTLKALHKLCSAMSKSSLRVLVSSPLHSRGNGQGESRLQFPQREVQTRADVPQPGITTKAPRTTLATDPPEHSVTAAQTYHPRAAHTRTSLTGCTIPPVTGCTIPPVTGCTIPPVTGCTFPHRIN